MAVPTLDLTFAPNADLVSCVRRFVVDFYDRVLSDDDLSQRMGLAAHELLENAVKYSLADDNIDISIGADHDGIAIRTTNRATASNIVAIRGLIDSLQSADDYEEHYQQLLTQTVLDDTGSGLGLGRICAESAMTLSCESQGDRLYVTARAPLKGQP